MLKLQQLCSYFSRLCLVQSLQGRELWREGHEVQKLLHSASLGYSTTPHLPDHKQFNTHTHTPQPEPLPTELPTYRSSKRVFKAKDPHRETGLFKSVLLKMWSLDQQHQRHLGNLLEVQILKPHQDLLNQKLWG